MEVLSPLLPTSQDIDCLGKEISSRAGTPIGDDCLEYTFRSKSGCVELLQHEQPCLPATATAKAELNKVIYREPLYERRLLPEPKGSPQLPHRQTSSDRVQLLTTDRQQSTLVSLDRCWESTEECTTEVRSEMGGGEVALRP